MTKKQKNVIGLSIIIAGASTLGILATALASPLIDPDSVMPMILGFAGTAIASVTCTAGYLLIPILCPQPDDATSSESNSAPRSTTRPPPTTTPSKLSPSDLREESTAPPSPFPSLKLELTRMPSQELSSKQESVSLQTLSPVNRSKPGSKVT